AAKKRICVKTEEAEMIKAVGLILMFLVCTAGGAFKSLDLSKRVRQLESFMGAITLISTEIRYFASPTDVIMGKIGALDEYKELRVFGLCRKNLDQYRDFPKAWEQSIEQSKPYLSLNDSDYETLLWFGKVLGTTDVEGETANCERYKNLLGQRLQRAREDQRKRGRMYTSLGVLAGVFIVVLLV
ncbi:MAG TPA: stage III sporulation protein AB, partial [Clostridia bacterium]|nr:stage III sporulation protein AB [Clostridia bacterium]